MFGHILIHESKSMLLHRSEFFSMQNYRVYPKVPKRNAQSFQPKSSGNQKKTTEAWRNGARLLTKIYYSLEAVMSPNATKAFTTKNVS